MTAEQTPAGPTSTTVGWLELFFDLVVVAAVAVLTHGLQEDPGVEGLALFAMLFTAIWFSWVSVVLYANVAGDATRTRTIVVGMFLVAVMAASSPLHFEERANAFAGAFLVLRVVTGQGSLHTGRVLITWPLLQLGGATVPWLVSLWVDTPWKYALWGVGLLLDLVVVVAGTGWSTTRAWPSCRRGSTGCRRAGAGPVTRPSRSRWSASTASTSPNVSDSS